MHRGLEKLRLVPDPAGFLSYGDVFIHLNTLIDSINHLLSKFILSPFCALSTVLGTGVTAVSKETKSPPLWSSVLMWETDNNQIKDGSHARWW